MTETDLLEPLPVAPPKTGLRTSSMVVLATFVTLAAFYFGREFFVPVVFAILLSALFRPVVRMFERVRVPTPIGAAIVVLGLLTAMTAAGFALSGPAHHWMEEAPKRFSAAEEKLKKIRQPMKQMTDVASQIEHATQGPTTAPTAVAVNPVSSTPGIANRFVGAATKTITALVEILLLLYLLLASGDLFVNKLIKIIPLWRDKKAAATVVDESQRAVMRYMMVNVFINAGQSVVVGLAMWGLGMPAPIIWGLLTFFLEFVPYMGATVMVALLSVISFATFENMGHILAVPGSYLLITTIQNNVVSPFLYGQHLKLNPVAVLVGVLLWWFLWGIPGAFLAVPIIATFKIISDHVDTLKPVGEFLGE